MRRHEKKILEVGVIIVDGKQIEELHVIRARKLLAFKKFVR
jgi:hypothetical protein